MFSNRETRLDIEELPVTTPLLMNTVVQGEQSNGYSKSHEPTQNFSKNHSEVNTPSTTSNANNTEFLEPRQLSNSRLHKLNTKLLEAIKSSDTEEIKRLLGGGAKANATCCLTFISACHLAALSGGDALAILLKNGAEKHERDKQGITPLHVAALAGNARHMAMLLDFPEGVPDTWPRKWLRTDRRLRRLNTELLEAIASCDIEETKR
ncbi:uncharacterized protein LOC113230416 [Hyposmocoma kahamanoa]|uniref:uncharacterized protein LOC113230416 n=1 Tax=Hyposmocoma kahamanoa TaxID=1477025 RepID=UPI000E6D6D5B|nr:uncharacterized protein LOC113230416 [Hyposmocoma kahamanoa]